MAVAMPENVGSWRVMEKVGMRYEGTADYYGATGLKKYVAERDWWRPPTCSRTAGASDELIDQDA
jgi:RimJ/RimL family protein N-acetyltransferase